MRNFSVFQIVLIAAFVVFAGVGVAIFAGFGGFTQRSEESVGRVVMWGTLPRDVMQRTLSALRFEREGFDGVSYEEKDPRSYQEELVNALAAGRGPDLFLLSQEQMLTQRDKLALIPYGAVSERSFKDTFIEEGELYLTPEGIVALPLTVDPMVMYWNRDIFSAEGIAEPPRFWDEFFVLAPQVTELDRASNILRSFVAFGEYRNVAHAKEILSTLILQAGNPIVTRTVDGGVSSVFGLSLGAPTPPAEAALRFYTEFANPVKSVYSWNRALPSSRQAFVAGDLAVYFGFASEMPLLGASNPNLNFDVATMPQSRGARAEITFGRMQGVAIARSATNPASALAVAQVFTEREVVEQLSGQLGLPPVRRDLLRARPSDAFGAVFRDSALMARAWLDPDAEATERIFQRMIESTLSGRARLSGAVSDADRELEQLLER